jgi:hypothetical protein
MPCHCAKCGLPIVRTGNPLARELAKKIAKAAAKDAIKEAGHYAGHFIENAKKEAKHQAPHIIDKLAGAAKKGVSETEKKAVRAVNGF